MNIKKPKPLANPRRPDWEAIEREYRAGQLSIRQIARQRGTRESTLRKRAQKQGWSRDLADVVRQRVHGDLVRSAHPAHLSDDAIIDYAATRGVEVVRQHRDHLGRMQRIATMLLEILLSGNKPDVAFLGLKETPADALAKIAQATARWMPLERQAFGLDKRGDDDDAPKPATSGIDWRDLFDRAGIVAPADGGIWLSNSAVRASPRSYGSTDRSMK